MAAIDYEIEYNNRARVPEHAEIFARWMREAEDYRTEAMQERRAELGLTYGSTPRQFIDLFSPSKAAKAPLALFIHGGYWRSLDPSMFSHVARGLNAHGVTVAVAGYNLCPQVSIADIIEEIRHALPVSLAAHRPARDGVRPFRRRPSRRRHAGDRLARALSEDAARPRARRLFDLRRVRSHAAASRSR